MKDMWHDLAVNGEGRLRSDFGNFDNAADACAGYRMKNSGFPKEYWWK